MNNVQDISAGFTKYIPTRKPKNNKVNKLLNNLSFVTIPSAISI